MTVKKLSLDTVKNQTWSVYQNRARQWDEGRDRSLVERIWLDRFATSLPRNAHILDLGCGSGEPVSKHYLDNGFQVTGIDYAPAMIDMARTRFPSGSWLVQDMRQMQINTRFNGVISWDGFFHLSQSDQRYLLPKLADLLFPGGVLLLTVGPNEGEVTGTVAGETVYHASLSPREYRQLLSRSGFDAIRFQADDPQCGHHSVLMARRK